MGQPNLSLLWRNASFTPALSQHVGGATYMHQKSEGHAHEFDSVYGMVGPLFLVAALACTTTAPARDLTERGNHR